LFPGLYSPDDAVISLYSHNFLYTITGMITDLYFYGFFIPAKEKIEAIPLSYIVPVLFFIFRLESLSVWPIPVFRYGLLMRNRGYIEFETLKKTVLVISKEY
jgi:hypothetical protein